MKERESECVKERKSVRKRERERESMRESECVCVCGLVKESDPDCMSDREEVR